MYIVSLCYSEPNAYIIYSRYQLYVYGKKICNLAHPEYYIGEFKD